MPSSSPRRTVMVSGASRGIGQAIAIRLLADGHNLSLGLRRPMSAADWLRHAREQSDGPELNVAEDAVERLLIHPYDARCSDQADGGAEDGAEGPAAWVAATVQRWGGVGALVHCAGVFSRVGLCYDDADEEQIATLLNVNLMGPWRLSRAAWPWLERDGDGRVLTLVSMSGKRVKGRLAAYATSKFALMALCQAMRNEGWEQGIRVTAICPSWVNTAMAAAVTAVPKQAMTQPEDLATTAAHLLELPGRAVPFEVCVNCQLET